MNQVWRIVSGGFFLLLVLAWIGCTNQARRPLTTERPLSRDLVGRYVLIDQTVIPGHALALQEKSISIELRSDESFTAQNLPRDSAATGTVFIESLQSGTGTWNVYPVFASDNNGGWAKDPQWGVVLSGYGPSGDSFMAIRLVGNEPPYGMLFFAGRPDMGTALVLEKER
jgi:hypothetical protein